MSRIITQVIRQAAASLDASLELFYPSYGRNGLNESNLTYRMARAFEARPHSHAFMEVPFLNADETRYDQRIDCLLFDRERVLFVEAKRLYSPDKAEQMRQDFQRLSLANLTPILEKFTVQRQRRVYRVLLAETWQARTADWWRLRDSSREWDNGWLPEQRGVLPVRSYDNGNTLYWLYAYEELTLPTA